MNGKALGTLAGIVLLVVGGFIFMSMQGNATGATITGGSIGVAQGDTQHITLGIEGSNYAPNTIRVVAEKPVSITLDSSVTGCYRSFNIKELGVSKYSKSPGETITFTPKKAGTYRFSCSMGMGYGTLIVE